MEIKTDKDYCPACGADRLTFGAADVLAWGCIEYPCTCDRCGWQGFKQYKHGVFLGFMSAAGVVCGYSLT